MAITSDYMFNGMSRIGNDGSDVSQRNIQNTKEANYHLHNHHTRDVDMKSGISLALTQPTINL